MQISCGRDWNENPPAEGRDKLRSLGECVAGVVNGKPGLAAKKKSKMPFNFC
jgi:hypothetical protein